MLYGSSSQAEAADGGVGGIAPRIGGGRGGLYDRQVPLFTLKPRSDESIANNPQRGGCASPPWCLVRYDRSGGCWRGRSNPNLAVVVSMMLITPIRIDGIYYCATSLVEIIDLASGAGAVHQA
jgi:hypothetical protein